MCERPMDLMRLPLILMTAPIHVMPGYRRTCTVKRRRLTHCFADGKLKTTAAVGRGVLCAGELAELNERVPLAGGFPALGVPGVPGVSWVPGVGVGSRRGISSPTRTGTSLLVVVPFPSWPA